EILRIHIGSFYRTSACSRASRLEISGRRSIGGRHRRTSRQLLWRTIIAGHGSVAPVRSPHSRPEGPALCRLPGSTATSRAGNESFMSECPNRALRGPGRSIRRSTALVHVAEFWVLGSGSEGSALDGAEHDPRDEVP